MSTQPVVIKHISKIQSFFEKFGHDLELVFNAGANIAEAEQPVIEPLIPPAQYTTYVKLSNFAAQQVAAADAKYKAIGKENVPFAVKVAEAVAIGGEGALAIAAQAGVQIAHLPTFFAAAAQSTSVLNFQTLTEAPTTAA